MKEEEQLLKISKEILIIRQRLDTAKTNIIEADMHLEYLITILDKKEEVNK